MRLRPLALFVVVPALLLMACPGPVDPAPPEPDAGDAGELDGGVDAGETHPFDSAPQAASVKETVQAPTLASGTEAILFTTSRLADANSNFAVNRIELSRVIGADLYVYDPRQPGKLLLVGQPDLGRVDLVKGQYLGPSPLERQKVATRELAWDPIHGLWAFMLEPINDEWLLARWNLSSFGVAGQRFSVDFWALPPTTDKLDTLYWEDEVTGLEFLDGTLYAASAGDPASGGAQGGQLYPIDITLPPMGYAPYEPPNDSWYLPESLPSPLLTMANHNAIAGDLAAGTDGKLYGVAQYEDVSAGPADVNFLVEIDVTGLSIGEPGGTLALPTEPSLAPGNDEVEVLGMIDGELYGISVLGKVWQIDLDTGEGTVVDDLGPLFTNLAQIRIRGGTRVVVP